jgi:hypothetical protein
MINLKQIYNFLIKYKAKQFLQVIKITHKIIKIIIKVQMKIKVLQFKHTKENLNIKKNNFLL